MVVSSNQQAKCGVTAGVIDCAVRDVCLGTCTEVKYTWK